jgi:hypothetical protein
VKAAGIYQILHVESGRRYVGSSVDVRLRMRKHREQLRRGDHVNPSLQNAWLKHGEDAFEFKQVLACRPEDFVMYEGAIIGAYQANTKAGGYNLRIASESNLGMVSARLSHKAGDKHGKLTLLEIIKRERQGTHARYICDCGNKTDANANAVKRGIISSCGCLYRESRQSGRAKLVGRKFNRLTLLKEVGVDKFDRATCLFRCDCGTEKVMPLSPVMAGKSRSCGCLIIEAARARITYSAGQKYHRLTLVETVGYNIRGVMLWRAKCDCGGEMIASGSRMKCGKVKSCGCFRREDSSIRHKARHAANAAMRAKMAA